jgi:hypothetical protein
MRIAFIVVLDFETIHLPTRAEPMPGEVGLVDLADNASDLLRGNLFISDQGLAVRRIARDDNAVRGVTPMPVGLQP